MSLLHLAVTVGATVAATPSPTPSPEVLTKVVEVTPAWVGQLSIIIKQVCELLLLVVPSVVASKLHDFINPKLGEWANVLLWFSYSTVLALVGLMAAGQLDLLKVNFHDPAQVGTAILAAAGAAAARYSAYQARLSKARAQFEAEQVELAGQTSSTAAVNY